MKVNQIRAGAALSYVSMALSTIISLVYTPIMLDRLGDSEFGVYQAVLPIISYLNLLSFGLGSAYVRYYSRFRAAGDKKGCAKLNGMFLITYLVLGAAVLAIGFGLSYCDVIFGKKLTAEEIASLMDFSNAAGSLATTKRGAIPAMPDRAAILDCIASVPRLRPAGE